MRRRRNSARGRDGIPTAAGDWPAGHLVGVVIIRDRNRMRLARAVVGCTEARLHLGRAKARLAQDLLVPLFVGMCLQPISQPLRRHAEPALRPATCDSIQDSEF